VRVSLDRLRPSDGVSASGPVLHPFRQEGRPPALFVLEQRRGGVLLQRGVIGAVELSEFAERRVLPHEEVHAVGVRRQRSLAGRNGGWNEPVLLAQQGVGGLDAALAAVACGEPAWSVLAADGVRHCYWPVPDPAAQEWITGQVGSRPALIADGHHRYAAALALQREYEGLPGPWDRVLGLVVDSAVRPLTLRAIHRWLPMLDPQQVVDRARQIFAVHEVDDRFLPSTGTLVVRGAEGCWSLTAVRPQAVDAAWDGCPTEWRTIDSALVDRLILGSMGDREAEAVHYVHGEPGGAVQEVGRGTLIALAAPAEGLVHRLALAGIRMPAKATSFGPKPLPGQLSYLFDAHLRERV